MSEIADYTKIKEADTKGTSASTSTNDSISGSGLGTASTVLNCDTSQDCDTSGYAYKVTCVDQFGKPNTSADSSSQPYGPEGTGQYSCATSDESINATSDGGSAFMPIEAQPTNEPHRVVVPEQESLPAGLLPPTEPQITILLPPSGKQNKHSHGNSSTMDDLGFVGSSGMEANQPVETNLQDFVKPSSPSELTEKSALVTSC